MNTIFSSYLFYNFYQYYGIKTKTESKWCNLNTTFFNTTFPGCEASIMASRLEVHFLLSLLIFHFTSPLFMCWCIYFLTFRYLPQIYCLSFVVSAISFLLPRFSAYHCFLNFFLQSKHRRWSCDESLPHNIPDVLDVL